LGSSIEERQNVNNPSIKEIAFLRSGDAVIELLSVNSLLPIAKGKCQVNYKRITLEIDNMESAATYLKTKGIEITWGPVNLAMSIRPEFEDLDGLSIELRRARRF
jgi:hypothetical protein